MKRLSILTMRLFPLCMAFATAGVLFSILPSGASAEASAATNAPARRGDYEITGREYERDGIIYDVPGENETSRDAAVVYFPNRAVIPSYIDVDGVRYTVREIRRGAAQTDIDDPDSWVTLPPTLKRAELSKPVYGYSDDGGYVHFLHHVLGVHNVIVTDLDSFLNMEIFVQCSYLNTGAYAAPGLKGNWRLYLNDVELKDHDYVYPEGSPMGTNLNGLLGVKSITVPASDTARTTRIPWLTEHGVRFWTRPLPERLQFKADQEYDLRYYYIFADTLVLPRGTTEFHGYGAPSITSGAIIGRVNVVQWPESLKIIDSTDGLLNPLCLDELPESVVRIGDAEKNKMELMAVDTVTFNGNLERLENMCVKGAEGIKYINIKESDKPLALNSEILISPVASSPTFYFGRNIVQKNRICNFKAVVKNNKSATIIFGANVTKLPEWGPVRLRDAADEPVSASRIVCKGLTPPEFSTSDPYILRWKDETELFVPEAALETYRSHPVWRQFRTIQTTAADQIQMDREVVGERWMSLDGRTLTIPETGRVNIHVTTYTDGTTDTRKVAVPEK